MAKLKAKPKNLADFKAAYDDDIRVPAQIRQALASLLAEGREAWEYETDFMERCGDRLGTIALAKFRGQFEKHIVVVREKGKNEKRVWFADVKIAAKARGG